MKKIISALLSVILMFSSMSFSISAVYEEKNYKVGDIIEFGNYPQSKVDRKLYPELNRIEKNWVSYGYYANGRVSDYMKYADFFYNGEKYRAVFASCERRRATTDDFPEGDKALYENFNEDPKNGTFTYFKYEPLKWRVLEPNEGFIACESIIDAQQFANRIYENNYDYYTDESMQYYANNYEQSYVREWLNSTFFNTAFVSTQKENIKTTLLDNSSPYFPAEVKSTNDKIFLLSYDEICNPAYGLDDGNYDNDLSYFQPLGTDYAKSQGLYVATKWNYNTSSWMLRSANSESISCGLVEFDANINNSSDTNVNFTENGIVPACKLNNLSSSTDLCCHSFDSKWIYDWDNLVRYHNCIVCAAKEEEKLEEANSGDAEFIASDNPDANFEVDSIENQSDSRYVLAESLFGNDVENVYDINLVDGEGVHVQPSGTVKVKLPYNGKNGEYKVYRINDDGTYTDMNAYIEGSHIVFETEHFSIYVVVCDESKATTINCSHICHKTGFAGFIYKIIRIFWKLFGTNKICACGAAHY